MIELRYLKVGDAEPVLQFRPVVRAEIYPVVAEWQTVPLVEVEAPPRHWSDVLDVQLDDNREKVEKKYQRRRTRYNGLNQDKVRELDRAWEQYINDHS